jgi:hypothetical protein
VTFSDVRRLLASALRTGAYGHVAQRSNFEAKNWLAHGRVSSADVLQLLRACTARAHRQSVHHASPRLRVHEFVVAHQLLGFDRWYLKFYFDPDAAMWRVVSVHPEER